VNGVQNRALRAKLRYRHVKIRTTHGLTIPYLEGWHAIADEPHLRLRQLGSNDDVAALPVARNAARANRLLLFDLMASKRQIRANRLNAQKSTRAAHGHR
jgi:hypothetical protein